GGAADLDAVQPCAAAWWLGAPAGQCRLVRDLCDARGATLWSGTDAGDVLRFGSRRGGAVRGDDAAVGVVPDRGIGRGGGADRGSGTLHLPAGAGNPASRNRGAGYARAAAG